MKILLFVLGIATAVLAADDKDWDNWDSGFFASADYAWPRGTVGLSELDSIPLFTSKSSVVYPADLVGSGVIGRIGGMASLRPDGSVAMLAVTYGNDPRFTKAVEVGGQQWRFTVPMKDAKPVGASVYFRVVISEGGSEKPYLIDPKKKPNQTSEPTAPSGRGSP